jgi:hypothetical protein
MTNGHSDDALKALHAASERRSSESREEFPEKWDPNDDAHPNPLTMVAFPPLQKPANASSYLIEAVHALTGKRYTIWLSDSLLKQLIRAGAEEGMPVSIHRSADKKSYFNEALKKDVQAWQWTITTPKNAELPVRGGAVASISQVRAALGGPEKVENAAPELETPKTALEEALEGEVVAGDEDIPF